MKKICFVSVMVLAMTLSHAQQPAARVYSLKQAIEAGIGNNLDVLQAELDMQTAKIDWNQARLNLLPDLYGSVNHGINKGRSVDPTTNDYINQEIKYAGYNLSSGVTIFNGFYLQNTIKQNAFAYEASRMSWQQQKDNVTLNVIGAYLTVLNNEDLMVQAQNQAQLSQKQVERLEILNNDGAIKPSDLSDLRGQLSNDQITLINAQNNLETAMINLCQLMNIPYDKDMKLERLDPSLFILTYNDSPAQIYERALGKFALIQAATLQTKSAQKAIQASRGLLFPSLSLGASANSRYSSSAQSKYGKQLNDNFSTTVELGLRIPIFNNWSQRNRIKVAKIMAKSYAYMEQTAKTQVQQNIERAYSNMTATYARYKALLNQVNYYRESFNAAEIRFNEGVGTPIDYLNAKNNLDRANINFIIARYEYLLRTKILDYYQGNMTW
jgi:outer membrane protein